jgi:predicted Zn-dependent protease
MMLRKQKWLALLLLAAGCSVVPMTGRKQFTAIPSGQMTALGAESYQKVISENKLSDNARYTSMVNEVGRNVSSAVEEYMRMNNMKDKISEYSWEYNVIKSDAKNAFCMPGGKIAFYEGIMPICEDKNGVAVVMAHEVAHAIADHGNERLSQQLAVQLGGVALSEALKNEKEMTLNLAMAAFGLGSQIGVLLPYSRTHESEADELGLYFMAMAGYDPNGAVEFWRRMQNSSQGNPPEFLSTHPHPESRIERLQKHMPEAMKYYNKNP